MQSAVLASQPTTLQTSKPANDRSLHPASHPATLNLRPLCHALGAEVLEVDVSQVHAPELAAIEDALFEHHVLVFRNQCLTPEEQVRFTAYFGVTEPHPMATRRTVEGHPEVLVLENRPGHRGPRADVWHSDISFARNPPAITMLHALEVPEGMGDTMWANMVRAYDELSPRMRAMLDDMVSVHDGAVLRMRGGDPHNDGSEASEAPETERHPVVRTHPFTGRRALFVNQAFTRRFSRMTIEDSFPMLSHLHNVATRDSNVYRHRWTAGNLVIWDNRSTIHFGCYDYAEEDYRRLHRTTAGGERPV